MSIKTSACVDGSQDHHWDPLANCGWRCRDCHIQVLMYGDRVVHIVKLGPFA